MSDLFLMPKQTRDEAELINSKRDALATGQIAAIRGDVHRFPRASYDHTLYTADELVIMEKKWDRLVEAFQTNLLPERYQSVPSAFHGINFGTNNGGYQRAWMRLGYQMFGVEWVDVVKELEAYGCKGITASYFDLHAIETGTYDFGVLDRSLFNSNAMAARSSARCADGTYFSEMRRVLKKDGALIGILYQNWTAEGLNELASLGYLTFKPVQGKSHPFLAFTVDFSRPPLALPDLEAAVQSLTAETAERFSVMNSLFYVLDSGESKMTALYIPTNEIIDLDRIAAGWRVTSRVWWDLRKQEFFRHKLVRAKDQLQPKRKAAPPSPPLRSYWSKQLRKSLAFIKKMGRSSAGKTPVA